MRYTPEISRSHPTGGTQDIFRFPNGYSASVICSPYSYGGSQGLYELAVLHGDKIVYDTPITSDVEGYLTPEEVENLLDRIAALEPRS